MSESRQGGNPTWLVLARDVSDSVRVDGQPSVAAAIVMDDEQGLIVASGVDTIPARAVGDALRNATRAATKSGWPTLILCAADIAQHVRAQLPAIGLRSKISIAEPSAQVEEVFDSLVGHLAGRQQPADMPSPEEWSMLFRQTQVFADVQPWRRLADDVHLRMELRIDSVATHGVGVVLGNAGITRGFALYPGDAVPPLGPPGSHMAPPPPGTLVLTLDPPTTLPAHLVGKARRYQWPSALPLSPVFFAMIDSGVADFSSEQVALFTIALAAVLDHDREQVATESRGEIILGGGRRGQYRLNVADPPVDHQNVDANAADAGSLSIDAVLNVFLTECRTGLSERTMRSYVSVLELLRACLNNYRYQLLSESEERRLQAAYAAGNEQAFCRLFGPDKIAENLSEFLGCFMIRKVIASPDLLRASGTVIGKLVAWLAERGYLAPGAARAAAQRAKSAARDLPRASRLGSVLLDRPKWRQRSMSTGWPARTTSRTS